MRHIRYWGPAAALLSCLAAPSIATPRGGELTLAAGGRTRYVIVLASDAVPAEKSAASELRGYIRRISGASLPIAPENRAPAGAPRILVGAGPTVRRLLPGFDWARLGADGIVIRTVGSDLILAGGRPRGALYAVGSFLEETLGVRWWAPDAVYTPSARRLRIAAVDRVYTPKIRMRDIYPNQAERDPLFEAHMKLNGHLSTEGPSLGGHLSVLGLAHTFEQLLPTKKYFGQHPEWYSDPTNGNRPCTAASPVPADNTWQLSLTNDEARRELTKNALQWIGAHREAGMISISQNDCDNECNTPEEMAIRDKEGSPSGPLLRFVNAVAADIEKVYPEFLVQTLAYQYTRKPPRYERPRHNLIVCLCVTPADHARPLDSEANAGFRDDLLAWQSIAPHLFIWNYAANFPNCLLPYPNLAPLAADLRFFAGHRAYAVFQESDAFTNSAGDFVALRTWLHSHLMWNPNLDQDRLTDEFLRGYYGAAAPYLKDYIRTLQNAFLGMGGGLAMQQGNFQFLSLEVMSRATADFQKAAAAVSSDSVLARRVRRERLVLDSSWLYRYKALRAEAARQNVAFTGPPDPQAALREFIRAAGELRVAEYGEGRPFRDYAAKLTEALQPHAELPLPAWAAAGRDDDVIDVTPAEFRLYLAAVTDDGRAAGGRAVRMGGDSREWQIQYPLGENAKMRRGRWRCYIVARVQPKEGVTSGAALQYGVYDSSRGAGVLSDGATLDAFTPGAYRTIDLGTRELTPDMLIWIAPPGRTEIESVYVNRIILVRED